MKFYYFKKPLAMEILESMKLIKGNKCAIYLYAVFFIQMLP